MFLCILCYVLHVCILYYHARMYLDIGSDTHHEYCFLQCFNLLLGRNQLKVQKLILLLRRFEVFAQVLKFFAVFGKL